METSFEVLTVSVQWSRKDKVQSYQEAKRPLKLSEKKESAYCYDHTTYYKEDSLFFQVCIRSKLEPFLRENNTPLFQLADDLWIIKGEWRKSSTGVWYHHCPSINTPGELNIKVEGQHIVIRIAPSIEDFDFEQLKREFDIGFWELLISDNKQVTTSKTEVREGFRPFNFPKPSQIKSFLKAFEGVVKNPKRELVHTVAFQEAKKVKPTPATYKFIASRGIEKNLPSKVVVENTDVYENRFVCFMLKSIHKLLKNNLAVLYNKIEFNDTEHEDKEIKKLTQPDIVSQEELQEEVKNEEKYLENLIFKWKEQLIKLNFQEVKGGAARENLVFTITIDKCIEGNYVYLKLNIKSKDFFFRFMKKDYEVLKLLGGKFTVNTRVRKLKTSSLDENKAKSFLHRNEVATFYEMCAISKLESYEVEEQRILVKKLKREYEILRKNNFRLDSVRTKEQKKSVKKEKNNEKKNLKKIKDSKEKQKKEIIKIQEEYTALLNKVESKLATVFVRSVGYRNTTEYIPSMTFIQNAAYRNAYKAFNEVLKGDKESVALFGRHEQLIDYGVREIPYIYELWVLISTLKVLQEHFGFQAKQKDLDSLIKAVLPENKTPNEYVRIRFENEVNKRSVILHYQKELSNGKRPDIIVEISTNKKRLFLVLDAKFKNYNYKSSAKYEVERMAEKYGGSNYHVFVAHPCDESRRTSKKLSNLGGEAFFNDTGIKYNPNHKFGYLPVLPLPNGLHELKKALGLGLEYLIQIDRQGKKSGYLYPPICIACGSSAVNVKTHTGKAECSCQDCEHTFQISHCWDCRTMLSKHGRYWDYHKTSWRDFDIHCPNCGKTLADWEKG